MFLHSKALKVEREDDLGVRATLEVKEGQKEVLAIVAGRDEPRVIPSLHLIDARIDGSDRLGSRRGLHHRSLSWHRRTA